MRHWVDAKKGAEGASDQEIAERLLIRDYVLISANSGMNAPMPVRTNAQYVCMKDAVLAGELDSALQSITKVGVKSKRSQANGA